MRLLEDLERLLADEQSMFRAQLLREDIVRLRKLRELARSAPDYSGFHKAAMRIEWTQGNAHAGELHKPLEQLLEAIHAFERGERDAEHEARMVEAWNDLHRLRIERLVGCLSTPAPKLAD